MVVNPGHICITKKARVPSAMMVVNQGKGNVGEAGLSHNLAIKRCRAVLWFVAGN